MDMDIFNIREVKKFVNSEKFSEFLEKNSPNFSTSAFIISALIEKVEEVESQ